MIKGNSNYAFPIILKTRDLKKRNKFEDILKKNNIEFRRGNAGGGNQLRQPYLKKIVKNYNLKTLRMLNMFILAIILEIIQILKNKN